jgi:hypothetical protein
LKWKDSSAFAVDALLKGRKLAALHAEWRRAACSCAVVWLPVPVDRLTPGTMVDVYTRPFVHVQETRNRGMFVTRRRAALALRHAQWRSRRAVYGVPR